MGNLSFNYNALKVKIKDSGMNQNQFAAKVEMSKSRLSYILNRHSTYGFSTKQIVKICDVLSIDKKDIPYYFFAPIVNQIRQN